jgi:carotenoid cleavage dioxygenase
VKETDAMRRRDLLKAFGAGSAFALPGFVSAQPTASTPSAPRSARSVPTAPARDDTRAFHDTFENVPESWGPTRVAWRGRLPAEVEGTLFRNGPARMRRGPTAYEHWFDGDGMVQAYALRAGALEHRAAMVRTARYVDEERAGRYLHGGFGTAFPDTLPVAKPDDLNVANISVLPLPGEDGRPELLALWEGGSPWRIDPRTLATRGRKVWSSETDGLPFSAHPRVDVDGTVWSFGYLPGSGRLALYQLDRRGALVRASMIEAPNADMVHDFAITERHVVFLLMPLAYDAESAAPAFVDRYRWHGERASVLLVLDKATWQERARIELPAFAFFHLGNAFEDGGALRLPVVEVKDFAASMAAIRAATQGLPVPPGSRSELVEVVADLGAGRARVERTGLDGSEFPAWDRRRTGRRTDVAWAAVATSSARGHFNGVARIDRDRGRIEAHDYGADAFAEEHLFVPRPGPREGEGWLVGTVYDVPTRTTRLVVLDAARPAAGPVAEARLPYGVPLGLHGAFVRA